DVLVDEANAARGHELANGRRLVGAVNAVDRLSEIEGAGTQRITRSAGHEPRQIGLALDHFGRRIPIRPFLHAGETLDAGPGESLASHADAIPHRLAVAEHQVKE